MIRLKNLERSYSLGKEKFFYVLREINLDVEEGDFVSIMGPSGAGKSTLLHILGMHDHGWRGEYFLGETAVHHLKPKERATLRNEQIGLLLAGVGTYCLALSAGISALDIATFAFVTITLAAIALLASYIPALRATRADPMIALSRNT